MSLRRRAVVGARPRIALFATGSGGIQIALSMARRGLEIPTYMAHTSVEELMGAYEGFTHDLMQYWLIGFSYDPESDKWKKRTPIASGEGAGKDIERGRALFEASADDMVDDIIDFCQAEDIRANVLVVLNSLGGGTGSAQYDLQERLERRAAERGIRLRTIGVYTYPGEFEGLPDSIKRAQLALYEITQRGRPAILFDLDTVASHLGRLSLGAAYNALAERIGEMLSLFLMMFQGDVRVIRSAEISDLLAPAEPPFGVLMTADISAGGEVWLSARPNPERDEPKTMFVAMTWDPQPDELARTFDALAGAAGVKVERRIPYVVGVGAKRVAAVIGSFRYSELV